ncbi:MAG TPA: 30S ribosomal protein S17 [Acidobacteriota bacterium]|nr:30S ribosomal protein S17 [Acidobacteriota bacterium]
MEKTQTIGFGFEKPKLGENVTPDKNCPFYGSLKVRGNVMSGEVVSAASHLSATVKIVRQIFIPKYKRYLQRSSKVRVHNPAVINAKVGDIVEFMGCRPISKTKSNVIVRVVGHVAKE